MCVCLCVVLVYKSVLYVRIVYARQYEHFFYRACVCVCMQVRNTLSEILDPSVARFWKYCVCVFNAPLPVVVYQ